MEEKAIQLGFTAGRDHFRGSLRSLTANLDEAVDLLRLALTAPRFDAEPVERIRNQMLAESEPRHHQSERDRQPALVGDGVSRIIPMAGPRNGTPESVAAVTADDLKTYVRNVFARDTLTIGIVGDIDAGGRRQADRPRVRRPARQGDARAGAGHRHAGARRAHRGQSRRAADRDQLRRARHRPRTIRISSPPMWSTTSSAPARTPRGSISEVREKRGLAYSIRTSLIWMDHANILSGGTATRSDRAAETLAIIDAETQAARRRRARRRTNSTRPRPI